MDLLNMKDITVSYGKNALPSVENFNLDMKEGKRQSGTRRHFVSGEFAAEPE